VRRLRIVLMALVALAVLAPVANGASDIYANLGTGGQTSPAVDRYPLMNYRLDMHFSAVKASLTHVDFSGVPALVEFIPAQLIWMLTAFLVNTVISVFGLAFSVDLLNGSPNTAGAGALAPVADAIHNLYANTLGRPWMEVAVLLAGCWAMWRALVQRRYTETAAALVTSLVFCLLALAIVTNPDATIGQASRWDNEISSAFLSVSSHGEVRSGPDARRSASDQLFNTLVFRPWVALEFGGTEHCIRPGTGSKDHDPESVPVRPLAADPKADAAARARLHRDGQVTTPAKQCVDNTVRYPQHFLRFAYDSDDRTAEYDAINTADPSKVPDSDPAKDKYLPVVADKPVTDAMEKGGQDQRLLLALVIFVGELGAVLLLGSIAVSVLMASMMVLLLAGFSPVALIAAMIPGRGHEFFKNWATQLVTYLVRKAAYSLVLAILLAVLAALQDATSNLGWLLSFIVQSLLLWMVFLRRQELAGQITSAIAGRQPGRDTELRRLLGVAAMGRVVNPARRRGPGKP
jgi:TrbL/VirB6 plasmid conjugal transfer protein